MMMVSIFAAVSLIALLWYCLAHEHRNRRDWDVLNMSKERKAWFMFWSGGK